jgi:hypothetical protein
MAPLSMDVQLGNLNGEMYLSRSTINKLGFAKIIEEVLKKSKKQPWFS